MMKLIELFAADAMASRNGTGALAKSQASRIRDVKRGNCETSRRALGRPGSRDVDIRNIAATG